MFCPVRCSLKEIPSKGVTKIKFKRLKIIGVKSFNRLNILKLIIIKSNVTDIQSKSRYRHHHWGRTSNRTQNRTEQNHFCSWFLGINSRLVDLEFFLSGNEFPDFGLRWFFDLSEGGHGTEQRTEQNRIIFVLVLWESIHVRGINSRISDLEIFLT